MPRLSNVCSQLQCRFWFFCISLQPVGPAKPAAPSQQWKVEQPDPKKQPEHSWDAPPGSWGALTALVIWSRLPFLLHT